MYLNVIYLCLFSSVSAFLDLSHVSNLLLIFFLQSHLAICCPFFYLDITMNFNCTTYFLILEHFINISDADE